MPTPDPAPSRAPLPSRRNLRAVALVVGVLAGTLTATLLIALFPGAKKSPGFLGPGVLSADVNLVLEIVLVLGLTFGFFLARRGSIEAHRVNQTTWVLVNAALVATIMVSSLHDVKITSVADLAHTRYWVTWLHALIGAFTFGSGLWLVLQMNDVLPRRFHVTWWRNLMRMTLAGYWAVALLGFATYYFWYVG